MKTLLCIAVCCCAGIAGAQEKEKGLDAGRLMSKDANKDGKLSKEELGEKFWQRVAEKDANGDGMLDTKEIASLPAKGRAARTRNGEGRPGGASEAFQVREFKGTNGHTLRYSLYIPSGAADAP